MREESPKSAELCVAPRRGGVGSCVRVPPTTPLGLPTPAPDLVVPCFPQKLPLLAPSGAVRGLRWLLVRVPLLRTICGHSAKTGATRETRSPKSERGTFGANKFVRKVPRSLFRLWRALPPIQREGRCRARSTGEPARPSPTASAISALRAPIVPREGDEPGTRHRTTTGRGAARCGLKGAA